MKFRPSIVDVICFLIGMMIGVAIVQGMASLYADIERLRIEVKEEKAKQKQFSKEEQ